MRLPSLCVSLLVVSLFACLTVGCGGGGTSSTTPPPPAPTFTSVPPTAADEGADYNYQPVATSPDGSDITFSLSSSPTGATLSAAVLSWTPTHDQSRVPDQFTVIATTAKGGSATQSWTVTPSGVVNLTAVFTYWDAAGPTSHPRVFLANQPYPAALVPQSDGTLTHLLGSQNADGSFTIPHVPAGYFWLQLSPNENFWTSSGSFDASQDIVGDSPTTAAQNTTMFNFSLSNTDPVQLDDVFSISSNVRNLPLVGFLPAVPGATSVTVSSTISSNIDFSKVNTLFLSQFEPVTSGGFNGLALGPAATLSNVTIANGAVNSISAALSPSPVFSIPLDIRGSAWANNFQNASPAMPTPLFTDFFVAVQPFAQNAVGSPLFSTSAPNLQLLSPTINSPSRGGFTLGIGFPVDVCAFSSGPNSLPTLLTPLPITSDQDFGAISYGDPYPSAWLREFEFCEYASVQVPRPNSTVTDSFVIGSGQITALPTSAISPLIGPVQSPVLNGSSIFQPATLSTTTLNLSWNAPAGSAPFGYYVAIYQLATTPLGTTGYVLAGRLGTAKTSVTLPFITAGNTYVFLISAQVNAGANMESAPYHAKLPIAYSTVLSAPITINPGATIAFIHN